ncbi:MAG: DUF6266 family protein [Fermentimonas sp.]|nr:DUF6266 family protein [Fermentimonas sp.]
MGKIDLSNFGLSGRIGPLIAYIVNGKQRFRTYAKPTNRKTAKQTSHRTKFGFVSKSLSPLFNEIKIGHRGQSLNYGTVCGKVMREVVVGDSPDYALDYSKILIADGKLKLPASANILLQEETNIITLRWDTDIIAGPGPGREDDDVKIVCYNEAQSRIIKPNVTIKRTKGEASFQLPEKVKPEDMHFWLYMSSSYLDINSKSRYLVLTGNIAS